MSHHVAYSSVGSQYQSFISSLQSTAPMPKDWQEAKLDQRWRKAMIEEMDALDKNGTWVLTSLPQNK
jgi:hypothetical protein